MNMKNKKIFNGISMGKYLSLFVAQIIITFITVFVVLILVNKYMGRMSIGNPMDSISLANTFMVFVTFILVAITLIITLASIWFAKTVSEKKVDIIRDNIGDIVEALLKDKKLKDEVLKEIITQSNGEKILEEHISKLTRAQKAAFEKELKEKTTHFNKELDDMKNNIYTMIDKKLEESKSVDALNELFGGK